MKTTTMYGDYTITETSSHKTCKGSDYNFIFDKRTGMFARWGKTKSDDPQFSPIGPEILDLEISSGKCSGNCQFCYKGNSSNSDAVNMSFDTFKSILDKMPNSLNQIAFGVCDVNSNPDFMRMMRYSKSKGVIPNYTMTGIGLTDEIADETSNLCGAVAISVLKGNKDLCYDTVKKMTDRGMDQVNIHAMICRESLEFVYEVLNDTKTDPRLEKLNAVVFLGLKPKGKAKGNFSILPYDEFKTLFEYCLKNDMRIGFDSCSSPKFEKAVIETDCVEDKKKKFLIGLSESCESTAFSSYINVYGDFFPCSFTEDEGDWKNNGISVLKANSFMDDVWFNPRINEWRSKLLSTCVDGCRKCITFPEINK